VKKKAPLSSRFAICHVDNESRCPEALKSGIRYNGKRRRPLPGAPPFSDRFIAK
jgi:hypothetical protein